MTYDYIIGSETSQELGKSIKRYDYQGAADLFKRYYALCCEPWEFDDYEIQYSRRDFLRAVTRRERLKSYLDIIYNEIDNTNDAGDIEKLYRLIWDIKQFRGIKQ